MATDFSTVTEIAGLRATAEQLRMIQTRYTEAARRAAGRRVLEVACGPARGLGLLRRQARLAVGGDYTFGLLRGARAHYGADARLVQLDGQALPFPDASFDLVVFFEAIYYLPDAERGIAECRRVLAAGGELIVCSANREWEGFAPSPFSTRYFSAMELRDLLARHGFEPELRAGFAAAPRGMTSRLISAVRRTAVRLHLIPRTMAGKEMLKRLFYGPLSVLGPELPESTMAPEPLLPIKSGESVTTYKVLYAIGRVPAQP